MTETLILRAAPGAERTVTCPFCHTDCTLTVHYSEPDAMSATATSGCQHYDRVFVDDATGTEFVRFADQPVQPTSCAER